MVKYDLPRRTNEDVQLIERADGRYYSVTEVDAKVRSLEKRIRLMRHALELLHANFVGRRLLNALGISEQDLRKMIDP